MKSPQFIYGTLYTIGYFLVLIMVLSGYVEVPENLRDTANILLGVLSTGLLKVLDFLYGSSSGSKAKTAALVRK